MNWCGKGLRARWEFEKEAWRCRKLPRDLVKAIQDQPFSYALGLKNGTVIHFTGADYSGGDWVALDVESHNIPKLVRTAVLNNPFPFDRGVEVRLSEIAWVADAPYGS